MLRPRPIRAASALATTPRLLSTSPSSQASNTNPSWPLLQKRNRPNGDTSPIEPPNSRQDAAGAATTTNTTEGSAQHDSRLMLVLWGLSPSLNATDFYRLSPSDLKSWQGVITKVQQQRDPITLRPLGRYHISFSTAAAAVSYRDRLERLHKLAHHRLENVHGLWESLVPAHLRSAAGDHPAAELEDFTVTSGSGMALDIQRRRMAAVQSWAKVLKEITDKFEYGEKPPVVLIRPYPATITADELGTYIREDGVSTGCKWKVCQPQELRQASPEGDVAEPDGDGALDKMATTHKTMDTHAKPKRRFVVVCANDVEARRFHRHWNQKTLATRPGHDMETKHVIHASIINW